MSVGEGRRDRHQEAGDGAGRGGGLRQHRLGPTEVLPLEHDGVPVDKHQAETLEYPGEFHLSCSDQVFVIGRVSVCDKFLELSSLRLFPGYSKVAAHSSAQFMAYFSL